MKRLIIGTAGHVDHGKTALIHALTGVRTDRLAEEQRRGMSIELGFASFTLPSGAEAGMVDVPGHERFLKTMLAGAAGMDLVMMVIAADEGVMPQTREHLDILQLLRAPDLLIVLTKADLVEPEWLDLMEEEVRSRLHSPHETPLADAPMLRVSAVTRQGIPELIAALDARAAALPERPADGPFRLPVDRVFTMPGFGTVVTGTLWSGRVRVGEPVELQPSGNVSRARGVQCHGEARKEALAGSRVALNLPGLEVSDIRRGDVVATPGLLRPAYLVDVQAETLPSLEKPLHNRARVRLHIGADEAIGRLALLDREEAEPGASFPAQLQLEEPVAALRGDRFVLRLFSPMTLLGGGTVLDPCARRHRRFDAGLLHRLETLDTGGLQDQVEQALRERGIALSTPKDLARALNTDPSDLVEPLANLAESGAAVAVGDRFIHAERFSVLEADMTTALEGYHRRFPLRRGLPREEARTRLAPRLDGRSWSALLEALAARERIALSPATVRLTSHAVVFSPERQAAADRMDAALLADPFNPPAADDLVAHADSRDAEAIFDARLEAGTYVRIASNLIVHQDAVTEAARRLRRDAPAEGFTAGQARDLLGSSRKVIIPLLEHMDTRHLTRRIGDLRRLEPDEEGEE